MVHRSKTQHHRRCSGHTEHTTERGGSAKLTSRASGYHERPRGASAKWCNPLFSVVVNCRVMDNECSNKTAMVAGWLWATTTTKEIQRRLLKSSEFLPLPKGTQATGQQNNNQEIAMSEQTEWQKWCAETAPVMAAAGRGEVVQVMPINREWRDKKTSTSFHHSCKYRIKQRTIRIGEYDVPEPMREAPEVESRYWIADPLSAELSRTYTWRSDSSDIFYMERNICHSTREAAELHAKALISLTAKKD